MVPLAPQRLVLCQCQRPREERLGCVCRTALPRHSGLTHVRLGKEPFQQSAENLKTL